MSETALAAAFERAGYKPPADLLMQYAIDAWARYPGPNMGGARRGLVIERLKGDMTFALLSKFMPKAVPEAIGMLLNEAELAIEEQRPAKTRDAGKPAGRGQAGNATHHSAAPANPSGVKPADDRGHSGVSTHRSAAPVVTPSRDAGEIRRSEAAISKTNTNTSPPPASNLKALADKQAARAAQRLQAEVRLSRLDTVLIDGRPIGDCTVAEVRTWADTRLSEARSAARDARFAMVLIANLPSNAVIREWWKGPAEVDAIYDAAGAEHAS